ncbi:MAG: flagellar basal body-associated protein FliL [Magnetospirillum sp.]|nr:flagellar basal body-associated protein FliL [Magnetospirillum sp.]
MIFIVIAFLMMVGAVVGGFYFWGIDPLAKLGIVIGKVPELGDKPPASLPPSYVDFGLLIVPVIQDRQVRFQAELILRLEVPFEKREVVAANLPRLQHAFLQDLIQFLPLVLRDSNGLEQDAVRRRLVLTSERVMGAGMVKDIIIEHTALK